MSQHRHSASGHLLADSFGISASRTSENVDTHTAMNANGNYNSSHQWRANNYDSITNFHDSKRNCVSNTKLMEQIFHFVWTHNWIHRITLCNGHLPTQYPFGPIDKSFSIQLKRFSVTFPQIQCSNPIQQNNVEINKNSQLFKVTFNTQCIQLKLSIHQKK